MRIPSSLLTILALALLCQAGLAQDAGGGDGDPSAAVRLEPHEGQTHFKVGDPIVLDLVFSTGSAEFVVRTDVSPYLPAADAISIEPGKGWVRSHSSYRGQSLNGNELAVLVDQPVRVPVLINRTITFLKPGHYAVAVETERLRTAETALQGKTLEASPPYRKTNEVDIYIAERSDPEEAALVMALSRELEETKTEMPGLGLTEKEQEEIGALTSALRGTAEVPGSSPGSKEQQEAGVRRMNELIAKGLALVQQRKNTRRQTAERLAYLPGDAAVRAKVHFIATEKETGEGDPIAPIMVDGVPSARDPSQQLALLEAAWVDPTEVPTSALQTALRQAGELVHKGLVTDEGVLFAGSESARQAAVREYQEEINKIIATLPLRSEHNRAETIAFLKTRAVPNQLTTASTR